MNKNAVLDAVIDLLKEDLRKSVNASRDAADYAKHEEARSESKWDTQGLEASYLAAGQAGQARQWAEAVTVLEGFREVLLQPRTDIGSGALVTCDFGGVEEVFFFAPAAGGLVVSVEGVEVTVITPQSPVAVRMAGLCAGEELPPGPGAAGRIKRVE